MSKQEDSRKVFQNTQQKAKPDQDAKVRVLRLREVRDMVGMCTASIYNLMKKGLFPSQIKLGPRMVGWLESEIKAWLADKITARGGGGTD